MPSNPFDVTVDAVGDTAVLRLHGDVNATAATELERAYATATATGASELLLDFADVEYINSTGIALLVGLLAKANAGQQHVSAAHLTDHYREIFTITRLSDFMTIRDEPLDASAPAG